MVPQMQLAVDLVGQPQPQHGLAERIVERAQTGRMAVDDLVLQAAMEGGDHGAQRQHQPPGQEGAVPGGQRNAP